MRKQDKVVLWPAYFDSTKTRGDGRKVSKILAVPSPKITELKEAVEKLGFECELFADASYPKTPWLKTGMLLVTKKETKNQLLKKIAKQLQKIRSAAVAAKSI
ncbi:signal recognition particle protein Srp19 [Candidatus Bathyarchaeota archaeon]|nr:MAG: signal recognition particle protein Srp19 [Candidatus Bathyarchaeota archaeon]